MRLHTDFHDYYDTAVGYGVDENVHYNRFTKKVEIRIKSGLNLPNHRYAGLLGFCGKIYPFTEIRRFNRKFYDYSQEARKVVEHYFAFSFEEYKSKDSEWGKYSDTYFDYFDKSREIKFKQFFIDWAHQSDDIFLEYKAPLWMMKFDSGYEQNGLLNPKLKDYGFDRIKDSFTAFQEISMYLSNILVEQKEVAKVADNVRIEKHGFDLKKSFRKEKK